MIFGEGRCDGILCDEDADGYELHRVVTPTHVAGIAGSNLVGASVVIPFDHRQQNYARAHR